MPRVFNFNVNDEVEIVDSTGVMKSYIGKKGVISEQLEVSQYDYKVKFDNGSDIKFKESELRKLNDVYEPKVGDIVKHIPHQRIAKVLYVDSKYKQVELEFDGGTLGVFPISKIELLERKDDVEMKNKDETIAENLLHTFLSQYKNTDDTYTVPKELLLNLIKTIYVGEIK